MHFAVVTLSTTFHADRHPANLQATAHQAMDFFLPLPAASFIVICKPTYTASDSFWPWYVPDNPPLYQKTAHFVATTPPPPNTKKTPVLYEKEPPFCTNHPQFSPKRPRFFFTKKARGI